MLNFDSYNFLLDLKVKIYNFLFEVAYEKSQYLKYDI